MSFKGGNKKNKIGFNRVALKTAVASYEAWPWSMLMLGASRTVRTNRPWFPFQARRRAKAVFWLAPRHWHDILKLAFHKENAFLVFLALRDLMLGFRCLSFLGIGFRWGPPERVQTYSVFSTIIYSICSTGTLPPEVSSTRYCYNWSCVAAAALPQVRLSCWICKEERSKGWEDIGLSRGFPPLLSYKQGHWTFLPRYERPLLSTPRSLNIKRIPKKTAYIWGVQ